MQRKTHVSTHICSTESSVINIAVVVVSRRRSPSAPTLNQPTPYNVPRYFIYDGLSSEASISENFPPPPPLSTHCPGNQRRHPRCWCRATDCALVDWLARLFPTHFARILAQTPPYYTHPPPVGKRISQTPCSRTETVFVRGRRAPCAPAVSSYGVITFFFLHRNRWERE